MELSERLAKALGYDRCPGRCWMWLAPLGSNGERRHSNLPRIDFTIIETILAAIEAKGWHLQIQFNGRVYGVDIFVAGLQTEWAANLPTALAEAFCAAVEGEQ